ncbi:hypothetical protein RM545_00405 [Zunongwangia sp. F260]|uniref:Uncharacterized protein n=1 Tax=Autumnicola lenta TaxID=3075593 RepID=A0ABU3CFL0_9FLAO|nr:hypothetical protein [Zunongwangia sp. F260]MDT0645137.1 hypothetical protein [Zunongwangia sp. F260]
MFRKMFTWPPKVQRILIQIQNIKPIAVLAAYGMLPDTNLLDMEIMENTLDKVWKVWSWEETWGWDFPMTAMTAARLGQPEKAVDALFISLHTKTYLKNGYDYQDERLRLYLTVMVDCLLQ